ncbi:MAG TPA: hypothetical protein VLL94_01640, partial [Nitrospiraceae bacterium]|nr:hypothetical protein [Nitrospiraceae bacterium]
GFVMLNVWDPGFQKIRAVAGLTSGNLTALQIVNELWSRAAPRLAFIAFHLNLIAIAWIGVLLWRSRTVELLKPRETMAMHPALWAIMGLMIFNGFNPYLGLKTETSFAMYSNLRTEDGRSNHVLIRKPLTLASYQTDLIGVIDSNDPTIAGFSRGWDAVPAFWVRRRVSQLAERGRTGITLTYTRNGETRSLTTAETDPEFSRPPSWIESKFLNFRVFRATLNECMH